MLDSSMPVYETSSFWRSMAVMEESHSLYTAVKHGAAATVTEYRVFVNVL